VLAAAVSALSLAIGLSGCGGNDRRPTGAVSGTVDLPRRAPAITGGEAFGFTGRVTPAASAVTVATADGSQGPVVVERSGRFSAAVGGLRPGTNHIRLRATRPGHRPWRVNLRVARRSAAPEVIVPRLDTVPPVALLRFRAAPGKPGVLGVSPSAPGDHHQVVNLTEPSFNATAITRDAGGAGRIRLSTTYRTRCGDRVGPTHVSLPPAQIENVRLAPGTRISVEETRTATMRLDAAPGCSVSGQAWAEATDAQGLQAVSRHVAFKYGPDG